MGEDPSMTKKPTQSNSYLLLKTSSNQLIRTVTEEGGQKELSQEESVSCLQKVPELSDHGFAKNHHDS